MRSTNKNNHNFWHTRGKNKILKKQSQS